MTRAWIIRFGVSEGCQALTVAGAGAGLRVWEQGVVEAGRRSQFDLVREGSHQVSGVYLNPHAFSTRWDRPLPPPPAGVEATPFGPGAETLRRVRAVVLQYATTAGLDPVTIENLMVAANEVATNSLRHGDGHGALRLWREADSLICQISDGGRLDAPRPLGLRPPTVEQDHGRGLWLAHQLCDLVQIRRTPTGTTVRLHIRPVA